MPVQLLWIAYVGWNYYGAVWQPSHPTIASHLANAMRRAGLLCNWDQSKRPPLQFASRTDRGVSAIGQISMIESSKPIRIRQLSAHLPHDIVIWAEVPLDPSCNNFHPSKSAVTKTYSYYAPLESNAIDLDGVQESLNMLLGQHDFANFGKKDPSRPKSHTVRVLHDADVGILEDEWHGVLRFRFTSDGFLWQQCRRMVTHLLDVGYNRTDPGFTKVLLEANSAVEKPFPQNPHGLVLEHIECPSIPKGKEISSYSLDRFLKHLSALLRNAATQKAVLQGLEESFLESERGTRRGC